ncbi:YihY/virulence factor BrkB family protein [Cellulosimicrobium protaetiae]|uniref:YihY/virulence factor BrkB family protein n=1 Tax=Cellulosimicrobium protaetiae TaxID=2587808 RepID=A0A6M5UEK1_9MICO|nr:YihY/virulence factor BrkB family protein [Cellulosimicrobium protaetiae]QJW35079.1 YihY/virulence factor BrkB family protein [Cellulosimicrobium protaetiae]
MTSTRPAPEAEPSPGDRPAPDADVKPGSPTDLHRPSWGFALKGAVREFMDDQCTDLAAALTYYAVLAAAPALLALVSILGLVGDGEKAVDSVLTSVEGVVPSTTLDMIRPLVEQAANTDRAGFALVIGVVLALWSASGYVGAFSRSMNRIYEVEEGRPIWKLRPVMLGVTVVVVVLAALVVASLVLSGPIARQVGELVGLGDTAIAVWQVAKWPVAILLVVVLVALLFHLTPNVKQPRFRWVSPGALLAILVWALASAAFGLYLGSGLSSYGATYGTLAGVIIFLLWLWITNLALLLGAELDAEVERSRELQGGIPAEERLQLPPRDTSASDKKAAKREEAVAQARALRESRGRSADSDGSDDTDGSDGTGSGTGTGRRTRDDAS